jgi:hypothetical protein
MSINPNSRLTVTIAGAVVIGGALIHFGWRANDFLREIRDEVADMRREVRSMSVEQWTVSDQNRWSYQLEKLNRERGLVVPEATGRARPPDTR